MILTHEERKKFCKYLELRIHDNDLIIKQMENLRPPHEVLIRTFRVKNEAIMVVLSDLLAAETMNIGVDWGNG